jgi:hypothetical protein
MGEKGGNQPKLMLILARTLGKHFSFLMVRSRKTKKRQLRSKIKEREKVPVSPVARY